jgi:DNA-binding NarL/FixJ family response regulator
VRDPQPRGRGLSNRKIAQITYLRQKTVETYQSRIFAKTE